MKRMYSDDTWPGRQWWVRCRPYPSPSEAPYGYMEDSRNSIPRDVPGRFAPLCNTPPYPPVQDGGARGVTPRQHSLFQDALAEPSPLGRPPGTTPPEPGQPDFEEIRVDLSPRPMKTWPHPKGKLNPGPYRNFTQEMIW